jgi:hypothetical protein
MLISEYSFAVSRTRNSFKFFSLKNLVSGEQTSLDFEGLKRRYCKLNLIKKALLITKLF